MPRARRIYDHFDGAVPRPRAVGGAGKPGGRNKVDGDRPERQVDLTEDQPSFTRMRPRRDAVGEKFSSLFH